MKIFPNYPNSRTHVTSDCRTLKISLKIMRDTGNSTLTFTKQYRVFTTLEMMALQGIFGKIGNNGRSI